MGKYLQDETGLLKNKPLKKDLARIPATDSQWEMVSASINAFAARYPAHWHAFVQDQTKDKDFTNKFAEGKSATGKKMRSEFRKTACFPTIVNVNGDVVDSLLPVLEGIIPALTHKDSVNYVPFLKKYPLFNPAYKFNV